MARHDPDEANAAAAKALWEQAGAAIPTSYVSTIVTLLTDARGEVQAACAAALASAAQALPGTAGDVLARIIAAYEVWPFFIVCSVSAVGLHECFSLTDVIPSLPGMETRARHVQAAYSHHMRANISGASQAIPRRIRKWLVWCGTQHDFLKCFLTKGGNVMFCLSQDGDDNARRGAGLALRALAPELSSSSVNIALDFLIRNGLADEDDKV